MNPAKEGVSFDEIIQADRKRKQNEALASEIFGRSRQSSDSSSNRNANRKPSQAPSLASRVGVAKRSSSNTNVKTQKNNPFNPPSRPSSAASQIARTNRMASAINNTRQANIVSPPPRSSLPGPGLSIRGTAGPFVVEATNFAPGTTAADIESALLSVATDSNGVNGLSSCRIMSTQPTVIAEMVFVEKHIADNVIATFNNQKADGRILHVYLKRHGPGSAPAAHSRKSEPLLVSDATPTPSNKDLFGDNNNNEEADMEDAEMTTDAASAYENAREAANQDRRERESRRAEPDVQDGSYGFGGSKDERSVAETSQAEIPTQPREDRPSGSSRRDGDRDRDRDRDRERDRRYDGNRYERRDDRGDFGSGSGSYHRHERPETYDGRGGRSSHYGNGVGGRGGYPGPGRMYSDEVMRGRRGSDRGMRGGYRNYR